MLIVDDEEESRYAVKGILDRVGSFVVIEASNGEAAVDRARSERPDVIVLDLVLPRMSGFQILDLLKSDAECRDIPVIIHTSRALDGEERRSLDGRVAAILDKCIESQEEAASGLRSALEKLDLVRRGRPGMES